MIISFPVHCNVDQLLCYVGVFAPNVNTMIVRIPQAERDAYFAGVCKTDAKLRRNGDYARCSIEWCKDADSVEETKKARASCSAIFQYF